MSDYPTNLTEKQWQVIKILLNHKKEIHDQELSLNIQKQSYFALIYFGNHIQSYQAIKTTKL